MGSQTVANVIDKQGWIDTAGDPIQNAIKNALRQAGPVKDLLHGVWLGHPLHPVLTHIPVGAWTLAMMLDAVEAMSGRKGLGAGADFAIGVGLPGALGSAGAGIPALGGTQLRP